MSDPIKILIVEDEEGIVFYMQKLFERRGYLTLGTADGEEAVAIYEKERPDLVLIDILLEDSVLDGLQVLENIKKADSEAVCVMITRVTDQEKIDRARELGALRYVMKPLDCKELENIVEETRPVLLQRRQSG